MCYIAQAKERCLHLSSKGILHRFKGSNSKLKDKASFLNLTRKEVHLESRQRACRCRDHNSSSKIYSNQLGSIKISCRNNFQAQIMVSNRAHTSKISSLRRGINQGLILQVQETIIISSSIIQQPVSGVRA